MGRVCAIETRSIALLIGAVWLLMAGCSSSPDAVRTDPGRVEAKQGNAVRALRGISTPATPRLSDLGDVGLLGQASTMLEALVGGDGDVVVAATMFGDAHRFAIDLVVLNRREQVLEIGRSDVQVVDATGHWLRPLTQWEQGDRYGLSSRRAQPAPPAVVYELDQERERSQSRLMQNLESDWGSSPTAAKRPLPLRPTQRPVHGEGYVRGAHPEVGTVQGTPIRVAVPPADGGVFWAYFELDNPVLPLTALVLVDGEQVVFRFDR